MRPIIEHIRDMNPPRACPWAVRILWACAGAFVASMALALVMVVR